ncbi:MAG: hypothetical protein ACRDOM_02475 [Nocardioides sp.]
MTEERLTGLVQPDQRSCGAAVLVAAQLLRSPSYAALATQPDGFRAEVLAMHRRVTSAVDVSGRLQLPWPQALGTPPWAIARQLTGTTGVEHDVRVVLDGAEAFELVSSRLTLGPVPVYVGSRWLPRHVVLATGTNGGGLRVYDPARGAVRTVPRDAFVTGRLGLSGWDRAWFTVSPAAP